jgi:hypothetical protein
VSLNGKGATFWIELAKVLTCPPKPIGKFTFSCFINLKEKQLEKLVKGSLEKRIVHSMNL